MKTKIISVGGIYLDINFKKFPHNNKLISEREVTGKDYEIVLGGSAINFARFCESLDCEALTTA